MDHEQAKIPVGEYAENAEQFNPVKFDADQWVSIAKKAGMKYIVITSKHHDGFAMFHTKASPYNIFDATPFHRDPLKELAAACKKQGMRLGFYYSQAQDWHHPGGAGTHGRDTGTRPKTAICTSMSANCHSASPRVTHQLRRRGRVLVGHADCHGPRGCK